MRRSGLPGLDVLALVAGVPLLMMAVIGTLAYNFNVILPLFAGDVFRRGGGTLGALTAAMGAGALIGALFTASRRRPGYLLLTVVTLAFGALIVAVAFAPTLPLVLLLLMPMGAASVTFIATAAAWLWSADRHRMVAQPSGLMTE